MEIDALIEQSERLEQIITVHDTIIQRAMDAYLIPEHIQQLLIGSIEDRSEAATTLQYVTDDLFKAHQIDIIVI